MLCSYLLLRIVLNDMKAYGIHPVFVKYLYRSENLTFFHREKSLGFLVDIERGFIAKEASLA